MRPFVLKLVETIVIVGGGGAMALTVLSLQWAGRVGELPASLAVGAIVALVATGMWLVWSERREIPLRAGRVDEVPGGLLRTRRVRASD